MAQESPQHPRVCNAGDNSGEHFQKDDQQVTNYQMLNNHHYNSMKSDNFVFGGIK